MGWANCGTDDLGRPIGYAHEGTCDAPGCEAEIDRGLAYVCGGMHGGDEIGCGRYFCDAHRFTCERVEVPHHSRHVSLCKPCLEAASDAGMIADEE